MGEVTRRNLKFSKMGGHGGIPTYPRLPVRSGIWEPNTLAAYRGRPKIMRAEGFEPP